MPQATGVSYSAPHTTRFNREVNRVQTSRCVPESSEYRRRAHLLRLEGCPSGAENEVLYFPTGDDEGLWGNVVLFPGDVQDLRDRMFSAGHGEFSDYCLESTARVLASKFPCHDVWVVLPKNHVHGVLASYDNFVKTDWASGGAVLEYLPDGSACKHLEALLSTATNAVRSKSLRQPNGVANRPDTSLPLTLVGFSKGAVVLNQLVTELAWGPTPAALSAGTPTCSKRNDPLGDGDPAQQMNNRKRSRVSLNDCGGGGRPDSSEGVLTNPPSPAMSWEGGCDEEEGGRKDTRNEPSGPQDVTGSRSFITSHQDGTSSLWCRLKRLFSLGTVAPSTSHENLDVAVLSKSEENLSIPISSSPQPATTRDKTRRRKRTSAYSSTTEMGGGGGGGGTGTGTGAAQLLFGRVAAIHWVDGGNGGLAGGSFPTNMCSLARLAALPNLVIRVHGSPYQWGNTCRPFLAFEADAFLASVEGFRQASSARQGFRDSSPRAANSIMHGGSGSRSSDREYLRDAANRVAHDTDVHPSTVTCSEARSEGDGAEGAKEFGRSRTACDVKRVVYFESEQPSLDVHFRVLRELNTE